MLPKEEKTFAIDVVAAVPGTYTGPASCAYPLSFYSYTFTPYFYFDYVVILFFYTFFLELIFMRYLYYTKEYKHWIEGMNVKITPRV